MKLLTLEQLLQLHALVIQTTGGSMGLRDLGRLEAAIAVQTQNVFSEELYPTVVDKAAALLRAIIADHPFVDGNKRTAMLACLTVLYLNDLHFMAHTGEVADFAVHIATNKLDVPVIATWINQHLTG